MRSSKKRAVLAEELAKAGFPEAMNDVAALTRLLKKAVASGQVVMQGRHYTMPDAKGTRHEGPELLQQAS